jgi:hypothetical protein
LEGFGRLTGNGKCDCENEADGDVGQGDDSIWFHTVNTPSGSVGIDFIASSK